MNETENKINDIEQSIKFQQERIANGREVMKTLREKLKESQEELSKMKKFLIRSKESKFNVELYDLWESLYIWGFSLRDIYVLQNLNLTLKTVGESLSVSKERVRQIQLRLFRTMRHNKGFIAYLKDLCATESEHGNCQYDLLLEKLQS